MKEAIESVTRKIGMMTAHQITVRPWLTEPPALAPNMDAGASVLVRASDICHQIRRAALNDRGGWTRDNVMDLVCDLTLWLAIYEKRTRERFGTASPVHPDEKDPAPEEVEINL
jgi:hypothetical protein